MSGEYLPASGSEIPRNSPTIRAKIGERVLELTWYDSIVQAYRFPYQAMTHLQHRLDSERCRLLVFTPDGGDDENLLDLMQRGFPVRLDSEPSDAIVRQYEQYQSDGLTKEITEHLGGEAQA